MRAIYEQVGGETSAIFNEASDRFADIMADMKQMAAEMQREMEVTRAELRRGIFDLPQETAESAAQMRRVIVDQIEALAELNRIVARHGRSLDAVEPMRRAAREEPTLSVVGGRAPRHRRRAASRCARRRRHRRPRARTSAAPALPRRRGVRNRRRRSTPTANATRGWLSDLLSRASEEPAREGARNSSPEPSREPSREPLRESLREPVRDPLRDTPRESPREPARSGEERSPRHSIESLDSLSVDIARMIDHEAATDLWDRYKRGERNVFTRRLYTLQGQKAFDEFRRKYRIDREFKQTVDRYIAEFERLLEEVSRDDRGQVVARTYLTSETGKVYTMLAHAAGRFE